MSAQNQELKGLITRLQDSFTETLNLLIDLPQEHLQEYCGHGCARGGSVRDLLIHNVFHEKQHTGQIWNIRDQLRILQGWGNQDLPLLLADYYTSRAQLIASLFGMTDEQLDLKPPDGSWTARETLEHVLYWDRNSIDTMCAEFTEAASQPAQQEATEPAP